LEKSIKQQKSAGSQTRGIKTRNGKRNMSSVGSAVASRAVKVKRKPQMNPAHDSSNECASKREEPIHDFDKWSKQICKDSYDKDSPIMKLAKLALKDHKRGKTKMI
jgi:hypothetical protein